MGSYLNNGPKKSWHLQQLDKVKEEMRVSNAIRPPSYNSMLTYQEMAEKKLGENHEISKDMKRTAESITEISDSDLEDIEKVTDVSTWVIEQIQSVQLVQTNDSNAILTA